MKLKINHLYIVSLLGIVGGFLNGYTYIYRGKVFATMQTGNIILGSIKLLEKDYVKVFRYLMPIISFCIGILLALLIIRKLKEKSCLKILLVEILCLFSISFIGSNQYDIYITSIISFVAGLQLESFSKINDIVFATTMCTGNLRSLCGCIFNSIMERKFNKKTITYLCIIISFAIGVCLSSISILFMKQYSLLVCVLLLFIIYICIRFNNE